MPTLYVENVPEELYEALRARARTRRKSISAEVIELLQQNVPTPAELAQRKQLLKLATRIGGQKAVAPVYLDQDVQNFLMEKAAIKGVDLGRLVNDLLKRNTEAFHTLG